MTPETRETLTRYARSLVGEVTDATMAAAAGAHPLLERLASLLLGEIIGEGTEAKIVAILERMLIDLFGDGYPLKVEASKIVIEDTRED